MLNRRRKALLGLVGVLIGVMLLSVSLSSLELQPGVPFPRETSSLDPTQPGLAHQTEAFSGLPLAGGITTLAFLLVLLFIPARLISNLDLKKIIWIVVAIGILLVIGALLPDPGLEEVPPGLTEILPEYLPTSQPGPIQPLGQPPRLLLWLVVIGLATGLAVIVLQLAKSWLTPADLEGQILQQAEQAVRALQQGAETGDVIIRCYQDMSRVLLEERGIERQRAMTAREFVIWLEAEGFPSQPIQQLSALFEKTRYGSKRLDGSDGIAARNCLEEIIRYCRPGGPASNA